MTKKTKDRKEGRKERGGREQGRNTEGNEGNKRRRK
jgi:hypothetical protein